MTSLATKIHEPTVIDVVSDEVRPDTRLWLSLAVITAIGLLIRIAGIDRHSFWYDEAATAELIRAPWIDLLLGRVRDNGNPPIYWLLAKFWMTLFGDSEPALRSLSVVFSVAAIPMLAVLARRLFDWPTAIVGAGLLAVSPMSLELANEARTYALLQLLTIASTLLLVRWRDTRQPRDLLLYCASIFFACLSHYYAIFLILAHGVALLSTRKSRRLCAQWSIAMVCTALAGLFWIPAFWNQLHTPDNLSRMGPRWPMQFFATPLVMVAGRTLVWRDASRVILLLSVIAALLCFWSIGIAGWHRIRRDRGVAILLAALIVLPIGVPLFAAVLGTPMYHVRAASIVLPAVLLLVARGITSAPPIVSIIATVGIATMTIVSLANYARHPLKDDWRSAAPVLLSQIDSRHAFVFDTSIEVTSFGYYARRAGITNVPEVLGITEAPDPRTGSLVGVRFESLKQSERQPHEYGPTVFDQPRVTVALCVPMGNVEAYQALFAQRGYRLVSSEHFHRIDLLHFARP